MWSPFSAKPLFPTQEWEATEESLRIESVPGKSSLRLLFSFSLSFSLVHSTPRRAPLFSPLPLSSFRRVREPAEWLILRVRSCTWGEQRCSIKAVSRLSVCSMNPARLVSEAAHVNTPAKPGQRVSCQSAHNKCTQSCVFEATCVVVLHKQTQPECIKKLEVGFWLKG